MYIYMGKLSAASNRADWIVSVDAKTDAGVVFDWSTVDAITVSLREKNNELLKASLDNGKVAHVSSGTVQWRFQPSDMATLAPGTYEVGFAYRVTSTGIVTSLIIATLNVIEGVAEIP